MDNTHINPEASTPISIRDSYPRWAFWVFPALILSMVVAILTWNAHIRYQEFSAYQQRIMESTVNGTAAEISVFLNELRRSAHLFADKESARIDRLGEAPEDTNTFESLGGAVRTHFPESFAYTIADKSGEPLIEDFDGLVGEICVKDMRTFATNRDHSKVYIHPHPTTYHFDVMVDRNHEDGSKGIFFVSFTADILSRILKHGEAPGHKLMLLKQDIPGLIEVTADGSRIKLQREFKLNAQEMGRIGYSTSISGTSWDLIDLPDENLYTNMRRNILRETILILTVFVAVSGAMLWMLIHSQNKRRKLEYLYNHDQVTGLPNRHLFREKFLYMTASNTGDSPGFALMLVATGPFRRIKGAFFEQRADDDLIRNIAGRLEKALCGTRMLARIDDTYYAVLLSGFNAAQIEAVSKNILSTLQHPFEQDGGIVLDNPSIGIASYPAHGRNLDTLIRHASMQIYGNRRQARSNSTLTASDNPTI